MDNFRQLYEPVVRYYNRYLYDPYMVDVTQYKGGSSVGSDWVSRHFQTHLHHIKDKYEAINVTQVLRAATSLQRGCAR